MIQNFLGILISVYLCAYLALWFYWKYLSYSALKACRWILGLSVVLHWGYAVSWFLAKHISLPSNSWESQLVVSGVIGLFSWILSMKKKYVVLGLFMIPVSLLGVLVFHFWGREEAVLIEISPWLWTHILLTVVGESLFFIGAIISPVYLFVEARLHRRAAGSFLGRYPSLPDFDAILGALVSAGFVCLTLGLFIGFLIARDQWVEHWYFDPKVLVAVLTWIVYALFLLLRYSLPSFRGRSSAWYSMVGALVVVFLSLGMDHFIPTRHIWDIDALQNGSNK